LKNNRAADLKRENTLKDKLCKHPCMQTSMHNKTISK
jgi:hypothetical protein